MTSLLATTAAILTAVAFAASTQRATGNRDDSELWTFDRIDRIAGHQTTVLGNYFKGAIRLARFTRRALAPSEFLSAGASAPERQ